MGKYVAAPVASGYIVVLGVNIRGMGGDAVPLFNSRTR